MSGWHSLSGYLFFRTGGGISLLRTKKKLWCVLEESQCQLLYFKSEDDVRHNKAALGSIDIKGAAITLDLDNRNQFIILCDGKEYIFTAENHESMMIWLLGLQAKRDKSAKRNDGKGAEKTQIGRRSSDVVRPAVPLPDTEAGSAAMAVENLGRRKVQWQKYKTTKLAESLDTGIGMYRSKAAGHMDSTRSRSLPPVFEGMEVPRYQAIHKQLGISRSLDTHSKTARSEENIQQLMAYSPDNYRPLNYAENSRYNSSQACNDSSSGGDSDDVFGEFCNPRKVSDERRSHFSRLETIESNISTDQQSVVKEAGSSSSLSVSSDSAIDKGEATAPELSSRLMDLEKELISTKCELAKVMNRQSGYQELLAQRDDAIRFLEGRLDTSGSSDSPKTFNSIKNGKSNSSTSTKGEKDIQERLRVLQHQNRFLNEEVKKLAKLQQTERGNFFQQVERIRALEAEVDKWKLDYVSLIRSSIRFPGGDTTDDAELILFGGDRHKIRIIKLLEDARKINPSLPTYESLKSGEVHVDVYGFKHVFDDEGLLLHYLCQELSHHFLTQAGTYEDHQRKWTHFMRQHGKSIANHGKELKVLCRGGVPDRFRKQVWRQLVYSRVKDIVEEKGSHYFRNLCNLLPDSPLASCYRKQISLDLMRTMPSNIKFTASGSKGIMDLQDVLLAYCVHNPATGYCQGMNFIVGMSLLFMDAQDAFWTLVAVSERFFSNHYFDQNLIGAQSDQRVLKDILQEKLPTLYQHLEGIDIEISTVTLNWFLAIFFDAVPFQTLLRVWDCFLLEGPKVLFRFTIAILKMHEKEILQKTDTISIMRYLKACAKLSFDVEGLVKVAFEEMKPFPRRHNISSKQACYLKALKEKHKQKELQRMAYAEREHMYMSMESETGNFMGIGAAVAIEEGKVWFCYGDQNVGKLSKVTCEEGLMYDINIQFDSRVMTMFMVTDNAVLVGTLSWMLYAYNPKTRDNLWKLQLHDAILSLCCYVDDVSMVTRTFAGLADGTLSVMEQSNMEKAVPQGDIMYIPIGQAPVSCLLLLGDQLWCASGNTVYIIHARTLDAMDSFNVSMNPYDHILSMIEGDYGIWIILRGSSILELWDPKLLNCKMLYDTRTDRYPQLRKEDDTYFNRARITAVLDIGQSVWVGTGEGNLIIYDVLEHPNIKTPTDQSPSTETISSLNSSGLALSSHKKLRSGCRSDKDFDFRKVGGKSSMAKENTKFYLSSPDRDRVKQSAMKPKSPDVTNEVTTSSSNQTSTCFTSDAASTGTVTPRVQSPQTRGEKQNVIKSETNPDLSSSHQEESGRELDMKDQDHTELGTEQRKGTERRNVSLEQNKSNENGDIVNSDLTSSIVTKSHDQTSVSLASLKSHSSNKVCENSQKNEIQTENSKETSESKQEMETEYCTNTIRRRRKIGVVQRNAPVVDSDSVKKETNGLQESPGDSKLDYNNSVENGNTNVSQTLDNNDSACVMNSSNEILDSTENSGDLKTSADNTGICAECKTNDTKCCHMSDSKALDTLSLKNLEPNLNFDKVMSRHHKVNNWLSSLEEHTDNDSADHEPAANEVECSTSDLGTEPDSMNDTHVTDPKLHETANQISESRSEVKLVKKCESDSADDVFYNAKEETNSVDKMQRSSPKSDKNGKTRDLEKDGNDETSSKSEDMFESCQNSSDQNGLDDSVSVGISEAETDNQKQVSMSNNPEIKYRLDFSGMHVESDSEYEPRKATETDSEYEPKKRLTSDSLSELSLFNSRQNSIDGLSYAFSNGKLCDAELAKLETWSLSMSAAPSVTSSEPRFREQMQTHSLMSRKLSLCRISRDFVDWNEMCSSGKQSSASPHSSSLDNRLAEFLRTPSLSSRPSSLWSSYENISTPSQDDTESVGVGKRLVPMNVISHSASSASFGSMTDMCYSTDLGLQVKVKIADRPVRTFLKTRFGNEPLILSFSGCHGDDEAVLKWKREPNERLWTNEPIVEICPKTKLTRLPSYMRNRLSSASSHNSQSSTVSGFSFHSNS